MINTWWANLDNEWKEIFSEKMNTKSPSDLELQELLNITEIYAVLTKIKDLEPLRIFTKLKEVDLMMCEDILDIEPLLNNIDLKSLNLTGTSVKNISVIKNFKKLEILWLSDFVDSIEPLSELFFLKQLYFRTASENVSSLMPIAKLVQIEEISITDNINDLSPIDNWTNLKRIVCYGVTKQEAIRFAGLHSEKIEILYGEIEKEKMIKKVKAIRSLKDKPPAWWKELENPKEE
jgi:hypothetical protein